MGAVHSALGRPGRADARSVEEEVQVESPGRLPRPQGEGVPELGPGLLMPFSGPRAPQGYKKHQTPSGLGTPLKAPPTTRGCPEQKSPNLATHQNPRGACYTPKHQVTPQRV